MPRLPEIFKYGIKAELKNSGFEKFVYNKKEAKDLAVDAKLELLKITMSDIMSKKYNKNNMPIKILKLNAKIPATLLEIAKVNEQTLPFKLKTFGEHKIVDVEYKDGKIYINGELVE
jgi:hypothetical protein